MNNLPNKALLRPDEVADYFSVTERTIRSWIKTGKIEAIKIVGTVRIPREAILKSRVEGVLNLTKT